MRRLLLCFLALSQSQSFTNCNPLIDECPPLRALGEMRSTDFTLGADNSYGRGDTVGEIRYNDEGVNFILAKRGQNPGILSNFYMMFGRIEAIARAAPGRGIVSSIHLLSDDLSEIDFEFIGNDFCRVQTNYFSKGITGAWDRGGFHNISPPPQETFHNYTINWLPNLIEWIVDGETVRTLQASEASCGFPQTPMSVRLGVWAAGDPELNSPGTVEWSGGAVDYNVAPFSYTVKYLKAADYSSGKLYVYKDRSGSWSSIHSIGGQILRYGEGGEQPTDAKCSAVNENSSENNRNHKSSGYSRWRSLLKQFHF